MPDLTKPSQAWNLQWDADWVTAVTFLGSSRRVAAGNNLGQILLWELPDKPGGDAPKPVARLDGHTNVISRLAATPDGKTAHLFELRPHHPLLGHSREAPRRDRTDSC